MQKLNIKIVCRRGHFTGYFYHFMAVFSVKSHLHKNKYRWIIKVYIYSSFNFTTEILNELECGCQCSLKSYPSFIGDPIEYLYSLFTVLSAK